MDKDHSQMNASFYRLRIRLRQVLENQRSQSRNILNDAVRPGLYNSNGARTNFEELLRLSNICLLSNEHTVEILRSSESIYFLLRELINGDYSTQLLACECVCNLSLINNEDACEQLVKYFGLGLINFLEEPNQDPQLTHSMETVLWTLTNLVVSGKSPLELLLNLNLHIKLLHLINNTDNYCIVNESFTALDKILKYGEGLLKDCDKELILEFAINNNYVGELLNINILYQIVYIYDFNISYVLIINVLKLCSKNLIKIVHKNDNQKSILNDDITYAILQHIRIIANIIAINETAMIKYISAFDNTHAIINFLNNIFSINNSIITKELLWLIGNIYNSADITIQQYLNENNFIDNLHIFNYAD